MKLKQFNKIKKSLFGQKRYVKYVNDGIEIITHIPFKLTKVEKGICYFESELDMLVVTVEQIIDFPTRKELNELEENETVEMWRMLSNINKEEKDNNRNKNNAALFQTLSDEYEIVKNTDYHYSITKNGKRIDYYPTSSKYHIVSNGRRGKIKAENLPNLF